MLIGVVGKPSAGKSTFFKASTLVNVDIADYPFTTIKPNHAIAHVRVKCVENEFNVKCNPQKGFCKSGTRFVPIELLDVAGLVPGAHEGKGMGNQFLDDLRKGDCLVHVVDASGGTNEKGEKIKNGTHNPCKDVLFLEEEIDMWYYNILKGHGLELVNQKQLMTRQKRFTNNFQDSEQQKQWLRMRQYRKKL